MINLSSILKHKKNIAWIFGVFLLLELISFLSFYFVNINLIIFTIIVILAIILAFYKLEWCFYLVLGELLFNSMGYIFFLENGGFKISLRIALWSIIMFAWGVKFLKELIKNRQALLEKYLRMPYLKYFLILILFIIFSLIYGIIKNNFSDAFFDFNAWLYFLLIFPLWHILSFLRDDKQKVFYQNIASIFISAVLFLVFKSLLLLFLFSHNVSFILDLYHWTRDYRLGEITAMGSGFYRVFLQSQIFTLLAWIIFLPILNNIQNKKNIFWLLAFLSLLGSTIILSFSRSFWVAGFLSFIIMLFFLWMKDNFKIMVRTAFLALSSLLIGFALIFLVIKFPWPDPMANFDLSLISERAKIIKSDEAAVSSRWALLEVMKKDLSANFILGRGFGARLEYQSSDPRVLENSADGVYSTYAFEWGWFDIWLKLGILGVFSYILLLYFFLRDASQKAFKNNDYWYLGLGLGIISLMAVNFFTPYLNHPLGIGFVVFIFLLFGLRNNK
ncbi:MAG TPA: hypothetical protein PK142_01385 [bacterium]|nr:hypothetical protein [bacterium]